VLYIKFEAIDYSKKFSSKILKSLIGFTQRVLLELLGMRRKLS
jgi:hypothetical protein